MPHVHGVNCSGSILDNGFEEVDGSITSESSCGRPSSDVDIEERNDYNYITIIIQLNWNIVDKLIYAPN